MSVMASAAAWGLSQWDSMEEYVRSIPRHSMEGSFYQALLHIHKKQFDDAQKVRECKRSTHTLSINVHVCRLVGEVMPPHIYCLHVLHVYMYTVHVHVLLQVQYHAMIFMFSMFRAAVACDTSHTCTYIHV